MRSQETSDVRFWGRSFAAGLKPRSLMTGSEWADRLRYVAPGTSPQPGPWETSRVPYLKEPMDLATDRTTEEIVLMCSSQVGKALCIDTPIPTPDGWSTMGNLSVGDTVFDENGKPCTVVAATDVMLDRECFEVEFSDGSVIRADADHRWLVDSYLAIRYEGKFKKGVYQGVLTTREMHPNFKVRSQRGGRNNYSIPVAKPLDLPEVKLPIKPYTLGAWLGDGHTASNRIFGHEDDLAIVDYIREDGYRVSVELGQGVSKRGYTAVIDPSDRGDVCIRGHHASITGKTKKGYCAQCARQYALAYKWKDSSRLDPIIARKSFGVMLRELGLNQGKRIPEVYLRASIDQRMALLRGIMDTDGTIGNRGRCSITLASEGLSRDVSGLLHSLGFKHGFRTRVVTCTNGKGRPQSTVWHIDFMAYDDQRVFRLPRKAERLKPRAGSRDSETKTRWIVDIRSVDSVPVRCIQVSSASHLFLAGRSMIPTHNSEFLLNVMGYYADQEPSPQLLIMPTISAVEAFSKERVDPTFRHSRGLKGKLERPRDSGRSNSRKSSDTILMKHFPGGYVAMVGANSPTGLSSRPIRVVLGDEVDRMPMDTGEGSPLRLARQRSANFHNKKLCWVSTPTKKGESNIEAMWERSDKRFFHIPCQHCGCLIHWKWEQVKWDKDELDQVIFESVRHECPECDGVIREGGRPDLEMLQQGEWTPTNPGRWRIAGFHISSIYSPWLTLTELVEEFVDAVRSRDRSGLQEFINLKLGELWEEQHSSLSHEMLHRRREYYPADVPEPVMLLTAGVDVQDNYLAAEIVGWGAGKESWGIEYRILAGDPTQPEVWHQLDEFLTRVRETPSGLPMQVACTCVDTGHFTTTVYRYTKAREFRRVYSIKGASNIKAPFISKPTNTNRVGAMLWSIGVGEGKLTVMSRLGLDDEGAGYCHFPRRSEKGYDIDYFRGLLSEKYVREIRNGKVHLAWKKIYERNEPLDCRTYAMAAMEILNPDFERLEKIEQRGNVYIQARRQSRRRGVASRGV